MISFFVLHICHIYILLFSFNMLDSNPYDVISQFNYCRRFYQGQSFKLEPSSPSNQNKTCCSNGRKMPSQHLIRIDIPYPRHASKYRTTFEIPIPFVCCPHIQGPTPLLHVQNLENLVFHRLLEH